MPSYSYIARDERGNAQTGLLEAGDEDQVVTVLQHRGLLVTAISRRDLGPSSSALLRRGPRAHRMHRGVTVDDQVLLCQQLATLVDAGCRS